MIAAELDPYAAYCVDEAVAYVMAVLQRDRHDDEVKKPKGIEDPIGMLLKDPRFREPE